MTRYEITVDEGRLDFFFVAGPSLKDVLARYTELVGRGPLPPKWPFGRAVHAPLEEQLSGLKADIGRARAQPGKERSAATGDDEDMTRRVRKQYTQYEDRAEYTRFESRADQNQIETNPEAVRWWQEKCEAFVGASGRFIWIRKAHPFFRTPIPRRRPCGSTTG